MVTTMKTSLDLSAEYRLPSTRCASY